jgi:hypothetical protein
MEVLKLDTDHVDLPVEYKPAKPRKRRELAEMTQLLWAELVRS